MSNPRPCDDCGAKMAPGTPRKRTETGLICPACASGRPGGGRATAPRSAGLTAAHSPLHTATVIVKNEAGVEVARYPSAARYRNYEDAMQAARDNGHDPIDVWDEQGGIVLIVIERGGRVPVRYEREAKMVQAFAPRPVGNPHGIRDVFDAKTQWQVAQIYGDPVKTKRAYDHWQELGRRWMEQELGEAVEKPGWQWDQQTKRQGGWPLEGVMPEGYPANAWSPDPVPHTQTGAPPHRNPHDYYAAKTALAPRTRNPQPPANLTERERQDYLLGYDQGFDGQHFRENCTNAYFAGWDDGQRDGSVMDRAAKTQSALGCSHAIYAGTYGKPQACVACGLMLDTVCEACEGQGMVIGPVPSTMATPCGRCGGLGVYSSTTVTGSRKLAHDSGDGKTIYHCPFCGGGQVVGGSDGTTECQFCHTHFSVQVQPQFSGMPQTIDGQPVEIPGMPGSVDEAEPEGLPGQEPVQPGQTAPEGVEAPAPVPDQFLNAQGVVLDRDRFMKHLAIHFADDREAVLAQVRATRGASR